MDKPLRVAVVGAGPAGLYAAGHLLEGPGGTYLDGRLQTLIRRAVEVDVYESLPTPGGLLRNGVAPDHPEKKLVETVFEHVAARPGFRFYGNIRIGTHVQTTELAEWYDAVIYAHGTAGDTRMNIQGEDLPGCLAAREFVAWYNGHPDYRDLDIDLSHERAVIIGNGNVALDIARILTTAPDSLAVTDVADHALEALRGSRIREVVLLGRRGPMHGAFNNPELEELGELPDVSVAIEYAEEHQTTTSLTPNTLRKLSTIDRYIQRPTTSSQKRVVLRFLTSPVQILGDIRTRAIVVARNRLAPDADGVLRAEPTDDHDVIEAGLVLRAIGYSGVALGGLPFDEPSARIPNVNGRVPGIPGTYVTGWIKRGPRGIIGTNKKCARDTVRALIDDADNGVLVTEGTLDGNTVRGMLHQRQPNLVEQNDWLRLNAIERETGRAVKRPRIKMHWTEDALESVRSTHSHH